MKLYSKRKNNIAHYNCYNYVYLCQLQLQPPPLRCLALTHHLFCFFLAHCQFTQNDHCKSTLHNLPMHMDNSPSTNIAHLSRPWFIGRVALSFLVRPSVRPAMVTSNQISTFFNIYWHKSHIITQYHLIVNTKKYQVKLTKYQPVSPCTDPVLSNINQYHPILTQYH